MLTHQAKQQNTKLYSSLQLTIQKGRHHERLSGYHKVERVNSHEGTETFNNILWEFYLGDHMRQNSPNNNRQNRQNRDNNNNNTNPNLVRQPLRAHSVPNVGQFSSYQQPMNISSPASSVISSQPLQQSPAVAFPNMVAAIQPVNQVPPNQQGIAIQPHQQQPIPPAQATQAALLGFGGNGMNVHALPSQIYGNSQLQQMAQILAAHNPFLTGNYGSQPPMPNVPVPQAQQAVPANTGNTQTTQRQINELIQQELQENYNRDNDTRLEALQPMPFQDIIQGLRAIGAARLNQMSRGNPIGEVLNIVYYLQHILAQTCTDDEFQQHLNPERAEDDQNEQPSNIPPNIAPDGNAGNAGNTSKKLKYTNICISSKL